MKEIIIKTQAELDALPKVFEEFTVIKIEGGYFERLNLVFQNSEIRLSGNATVQSVYDNATVQSVSGNATVQSVSGNATVKSEADSVVFLFGFAVAFLFKKARAIKKSKTATIIKPKYTNWFDANGIEKKPKIILFKRVSKDFKTQGPEQRAVSGAREQCAHNFFLTNHCTQCF